MTRVDLVAILPLLVIAATTLLLMVVISFGRRHTAAAALTLLGLAMSSLTLRQADAVAPHSLATLLTIDGYALFLTSLIISGSWAVTVLSYSYLRSSAERREDYYLLLLLATLGGAVLAAASHFVTLFLGLELLSVALFALIAYPRQDALALEAGLKYLVLAGVASAFLLLGIAVLYFELGTLRFPEIGTLLSGSMHARTPYVVTGFVLVMAGVAFKLSLVPFHLWTADVYQGAPAPVAAYLATVSKGAVAAVVLRYLSEAGGYQYPPLTLALAVIAAASILVGNLLALLQNNIKRVLGFSSIAHLGYLMVALLTGQALAAEAVLFYLVAYFITVLAAFGVINALSGSFDGRDAEDLQHYRGLFWRRPGLAGCLTIALLSLAGIPVTAGFVAKFYVFAAAVDAKLWWLAVVVALGSAIGLYYYLRIVATLYAAQPVARAPPSPAPALLLSDNLLLGVLFMLIVWLGIYPGMLVHIVSFAARRLV